MSAYDTVLLFRIQFAAKFKGTDNMCLTHVLVWLKKICMLKLGNDAFFVQGVCGHDFMVFGCMPIQSVSITTKIDSHARDQMYFML